MIRILHAADLHLDGSFEALAPEQAAQRREDERQMLRRLAELCRERACDLLLLAGDVFASSTVSRETVELLLELLGGLDTKVFIAPGSSDPYTPESVYATVRWPENVHIFKTREISTVRLTDPDICVCGAAFQEPREGGLLRDFMAPEEGIPTIMVLHGVLGDPASPYDPISEQEIRNSRLRYLALGHQHRAERMQVGSTVVCVPGCAIARSFDEPGPQGAWLVELDTEDCTVHPIDLGGRVYETLTVPVTASPLADVEATLPHDADGKLWRITLTGTCEPFDAEALRSALAPRFYALELVDETLPLPTFWQSAETDTLKSEFLRNMKDSYDRAQDAEGRRLAVQAARLGLDILEGREVTGL
jgi:DNA repair exonuclease